MARLLIVDAGKNIRRHLATYFERRGYQVSTAASALEALAMQSAEPGYDVILTDYRMAEMNGLELLREVRRRDAGAIVILMTAYATVPNAVAALKAGAYDYLTKPFSLEHVAQVVERALELRRLRSQNRRWLDRTETQPWLESRDDEMNRLLRMARQLAVTAEPILIVGERGVGKKVLARQIHRWSGRRDKPLVVADCEGFPEELLDRELFGAESPAASGDGGERPGLVDAAEGGSLLLEKVESLGAMPQNRLLRLIKHSTFERQGGVATVAADIRLLLDSTVELRERVTAKQFHPDLYHHLSAAILRIPPLRSRPEDILPLAEHILSSPALMAGRRRSLSPAAAARLVRYQWPGNVRELRSVLERAALLSDKDTLDLEHLPEVVLRGPAADGTAMMTTTMNELERDHIMHVIATTASLEEAAEKLGINPATLWRKRKRYGIG